MIVTVRLPARIAVRFMSGIAAAPMSSLAFFYMIEPLQPPQKLTVGLSLALTNTTIGIPVGLGVIASAFVLTGIYVRAASSVYDALVRELVGGAS